MTQPSDPPRLTGPSAVRPGMRVRVRTAFGEWVDRRALTGIVRGRSFPVVWVASEEAWAAGAQPGGEGAIPWPPEDVEERP